MKWEQWTEIGWRRKQSWPNFRHYQKICLEGLKIATNIFSQGNHCSGQNSNRAPAKYKSKSWLLGPTCSIQGLFLVIQEEWTTRTNLQWIIMQRKGVEGLSFQHLVDWYIKCHIMESIFENFTEKRLHLLQSVSLFDHRVLQSVYIIIAIGPIVLQHFITEY
jgi:hypothetical protein